MIPILFPTPEIVEFVKQQESLQLLAYQCAKDVWTIGYGHTPAKEGQTITEKEAEEILQEDITHAWIAVITNVTVELRQRQLNALVSFVFNVGEDAFKKSTLLKKINSGDVDTIEEEFLRWVYVDKRICKGLVKRREGEFAMWAVS